MTPPQILREKISLTRRHKRLLVLHLVDLLFNSSGRDSQTLSKSFAAGPRGRQDVPDPTEEDDPGLEKEVPASDQAAND